MQVQFKVYIGLALSGVTALFGGWSTALTTLVYFMIIDYLLGVIASAVFNKSKKTPNGALSSKVGWMGLVRKSVNLLLVMLAVRLDITLNTGQFIANAMAFGFIANEGLSIIENAGLCGVYIPPVIAKAIDILKTKADINIPEEV